MAWESRNGQGRYYTRSRRVDGRVVREYVGKGEVARAIADLDAHDRDIREARAAAQRLERESLECGQRELDTLCGLTDAVAHRALQVAGYHRHNRGEWRRRRG